MSKKRAYKVVLHAPAGGGRFVFVVAESEQEAYDLACEEYGQTPDEMIVEDLGEADGVLTHIDPWGY